MKITDDNQKLIDDIVDNVAAENLGIENYLPDLNSPGKFGRTPLMAAALMQRVDVVVALLQKGASVNAVGKRGLTALHDVAQNDSVNVAACLLLHGALIDAKSEDGVTPLMCTALTGNLKLAKLLLDSGADYAIRDRIGDTAAEIASEKGEESVASLIESYIKKEYTVLNNREH